MNPLTTTFRDHARALDPFAFGQSFAPQLGEANKEWCDHHTSDRARRGPREREHPKRRSGTQQGHCNGAANAAHCSSKTGHRRKPHHVTHVLKDEWASEPAFD